DCDHRHGHVWPADFGDEFACRLVYRFLDTGATPAWANTFSNSHFVTLTQIICFKRGLRAKSTNAIFLRLWSCYEFLSLLPGCVGQPAPITFAGTACRALATGGDSDQLYGGV